MNRAKPKPCLPDRWLLITFFLAWLFPAIACNYPVPRREPRGISVAEVRQTLAALPDPTVPGQTPLPGSTGLPVPDSTPDPGQPTATAGNPDPATQPPPLPASGESIIYYTQPGDTLPALAERFGVGPGEIISLEPLHPEAFLTPGQPLSIPNALGATLDSAPLLPDGEVVYSPSTVDFRIGETIDNAGGFLSGYSEIVDGETVSGVEILQRVAEETSTNPRLLLAFLEYRSHWVLGQPESQEKIHYPIGFYVPGYRGLYLELLLTATHLNVGYYGWRSGSLTELKFQDGSRARLSPGLNAGSAAVQNLFAKLYKQVPWQAALYGPEPFIALYQQMFEDPWARAAELGPLLPPGLAQPVLELPFLPGERWSFTGGPHQSWNAGTPLGAIDLAPVTGEPICVVSRAWVTASASGVVARSSRNVVVIDLDGDGYEQTGWVLLHLHVAVQDRIEPGTPVSLDDPIGHPSCERGKNTGTHVHLARKYNGEWLPADGPLPFVLSGWEVQAGARIYEGFLVKGDQTVAANPGGPQTSIVVR